jgi:hypothetical protein
MNEERITENVLGWSTGQVMKMPGTVTATPP